MSDLLGAYKKGLAPLPLAGLALALASLLVLLGAAPQAMTGWLIAAVFWVGVPAGSLAIVMIHHLTGGRWGEVMRPTLEAAAVTLPLAAGLFLPPLIGCAWAYPWGNAGMIAASDTLRHQQAWMAPWFVGVRALIYVGAGTGLALALWRARRPMAAVAAPGLIALFLLGTLAAVDCLMTRTVGYVSSIFGFVTVVGWGYTAWSLALLARCGEGPAAPEVDDPRRRAKASAKESAERWNQLGSLLGVAALLWGYLQCMNFLIAWMGNLLPESRWFVQRGFGGVTSSGWWGVAWAVFFVGFAAPFGLTLLRSVKRHPRRLAVVAGTAVAGRWLDAAWLAGPSDVPGGFGVWGVIVAVAVTGGFGLFWWPVWVALRALSPVNLPATGMAERREMHEREGAGRVATEG